MKFNIISSFAFILILFISVEAQTYHSKLPNFIYGTWEIYKYIKRGGTLIKPEEVEGFVGKKVTFSKKSFTSDKSTLFFDDGCKFRRYEFETIIPEEYVVDGRLRGTLYWNDFEGAQKDRVQFVKVYCSKYANYYFEVTNKKELAIYLDGHNFFLKKIKN